MKYPAAFINAVAEEGTKEEAIKFLQETWDELCEARHRIEHLERTLDRVVPRSYQP